MVSFDITRIFNSLWHKAFIGKLQRFLYSGRWLVHNWIKVEDRLFESRTILYSLYTVVVPKIRTATIARYAVDVTIYTTSFYSHTVVTKPQSYLNPPDSAINKITQDQIV